MKNILSLQAFILMVVCSSSVNAMTCAQFNSLGHEANSLDQVVSYPATKNQVIEFKKVIADHAAGIAGFGWFSKRKKALNLVMKKKNASCLHERIIGYN